MRGAGALLLSFVLLGCGSTTPTATPTSTSISQASATATSSAIPIPTSTPRVTPSPTPTATPTSGCGAVAPPIVWDGGPLGCTGPPPFPPAGTRLRAGTYINDEFEPTILFSVRKGWTTEQQTTGFFDIQDKPGSPHVIAVQFANVAADTVDEALEELTGQPNTRVVEQDSSTIDDHTGVVVVIETTDAPDTDPPLFRPVLTTLAGPIAIASGRRLWVSLLPVQNGVLAVMVGGSIAQWDRALRVAEPVLESVRIFE